LKEKLRREGETWAGYGMGISLHRDPPIDALVDTVIFDISIGPGLTM